jgi:hypothetical protein
MALNRYISRLLVIVWFASGPVNATLIDQNRFVGQLLDDIGAITVTLYQQQVIGKLQRDGTGAAADYAGRKGFVAPAEKFIHQVWLDAFVKHKRARETQLTLSLNADTLTARITDASLTQNQQARLVAALLNRMIRAVDDTYTALVIDKLREEGTGAAHEYQIKPGFVPLTQVFVRHLLDALVTRQQQAGYRTFAATLLSRWNLHPDQELYDDFARAGWKFLARQQEKQLQSGKSLRNMIWQPYIETTYSGNKIVLRFVDAVTASSSACIACHNQWEQQDAVKKRRTRQGIEAGKTFRSHELIGVLAVTIPLE